MFKALLLLSLTLAAGYKHHIETGEEVTPVTELDLDAVSLLRVEIGAPAEGSPSESVAAASTR